MGMRQVRGSECDSERDGAQGNERSSTLTGEPGRDAASAGAQAQLERPRQIAEAGAERGQVDVLGRPQRLQQEAAGWR